MEDKPPPDGCKLENSKGKNLMQRDAYSSKFCTPLQHDEGEIPRNDILSSFCKNKMSFQPSKIPSTSHHGSNFAENSKDDMYDEDDTLVKTDSTNNRFTSIQVLLS